MCEKEYMDKKSEFMKCEYCDKNFCSKCLNLTNVNISYSISDQIYTGIASRARKNHENYQDRKRNRR